MTIINLTELDKRLLSLLRLNARTGTSELARELNVSRSTIQGRIRRLEQKEVIKGYTIEYGDDYEKQLVSAHVLIKVMQKLTAKTYTALHNIPQVTALHAISGDYDMIATIRTQSTAELSRLLDEIGNLPGIERTNSSVILETKFNR